MEAPMPVQTPNRNSIQKYEEFFNLLNEYYLKVGYNYNNRLILICYNSKSLDNIRYEATISQDELYKFSSAFKPYQTINLIFEVIIKIIKDGKFNIKKEKNYLLFYITITDILSNDIKIPIRLEIIDEKNKDEFLNVLSKEIIEIRKQKDELDILKEEQNTFKKEIEELKKMV